MEARLAQPGERPRAGRRRNVHRQTVPSCSKEPLPNDARS
jgi:hypothetical protein